MAVGAFILVQQSLRWFIDNFSTIADWRAALHRVAGFRQTLINIDRAGATETHIEFVKVPGKKVTFENLEIATPTAVSGPHACLVAQTTFSSDRRSSRRAGRRHA